MIAHNVAVALTDSFAPQLNLVFLILIIAFFVLRKHDEQTIEYFIIVFQLVDPEDMTDSTESKASKSSRFMSFLKTSIGVGGELIGAVMSDEDGKGVFAAVEKASEMIGDKLKEKATDYIATKSGAMVCERLIKLIDRCFVLLLFIEQFNRTEQSFG